jgi:hypothetical protein
MSSTLTRPYRIRHTDDKALSVRFVVCILSSIPPGAITDLTRLGGLPLPAAPIPKLEDFVIRFVTEIRLRIRSDPNVAYRPADQ